MKKINIEFQSTGTVALIELFNTILEQSDYNLNQFVKGDSLAVPSDTPEFFQKSLNEFVKISPDIIRTLENRESFWEIFEKLDDYENNDKFIKWMQQYVDASLKPFEETAFLRNMDDRSFEQLTKYCFMNLVIKNIGKKQIDNSIEDVKQLYVLRKTIFTFIDMVIVENFSKEYAFENMERIFGLTESYCEILWELIEQNEDKLWKIMMMKQSRRIETKLNHLLEMIDE